MTPAVSVLLPAYNAQRYLAEAVESILAQTFGDFELIIIDDGSTDRSLRILRRLEAQDPRVGLVSRPNTGYVVALNEMIGLARGEFLARIDADDVSLPGRFAAQVAFLRECPDVVAVGGGACWSDERGFAFMDQHLPRDDAEIQDLLLGGTNCFVHPAVMMRRDAVQAVDGYDPEMGECEDFDLWLRLGEIGRLANLEDLVIKYRVHGHSKNYAAAGKDRDYIRPACQNAWRRRGIERRDLPAKPWIPPDFEERFGRMSPVAPVRRVRPDLGPRRRPPARSAAVPA